MKINKSKWLLSLKGIKLIALIVILIIITFSVSIVALESNLNASRILGVCQQEKERLQTAFDKEINKSADLARYLAVTQVSVLPENFTPEQYEEHYEALRQISSVSAVSTHVVSVILKYDEEFMEYGEKTEIMQSYRFNNPDFSCEYNKNVKLLFFDDQGEYMYLKYTPKIVTLGVKEVLLKISLQALSENCISDFEADERSYIFLENGKIIISSIHSHLEENFYDIYDEKALKPDDSMTALCDDKSENWCAVASSNNGITVLKAITKKQYNEYITKGIFVGFLFCALFLILVVFFAMLFYNSFIKPIGKILEAIDNNTLQKKDYDYDVMNYIKSNISRLHRQNLNLTETIEKTLEELKIQQIIACQMQINPHFLSNTLSAINWLSVEELGDADNPISNSISALSDIFHSSLAADEIVVTIKKEKEETEKYIDILKIRYGTDIVVDWNIEEKLLYQYILKTSIQPLIENSVGHAFAGQKDNKRIEISINQLNDDILVQVADNGIGIEKERLQQLNESINDFETPIKEHVGLKNLNYRIKLLYGEKFGVVIDSVQNEYTVSRFKYPKK